MKESQRYFYKAEDKLKSRKIIQQLFAEGKYFTVFPIKAIWLPENQINLLQAGVSVSNRNFKKAVDRNRIKRLMREAYRLQKNELQEHLLKSNQRLSLFLIYNGKELPDYQLIYDCCTTIINRLIKLTNANNQTNI